ncbi:hypothetical protein OSB04_001161 [Centaurea solstitialis]|uniref:Uncharacterized protein n=1 Tax=Centaurea solstitialis TaxID=347529 RepID=A0AA38U275_9ASTR|nr:hypothetical protein OSB04_001161 [Centaurea solstitialis]
MILLTQVVDTKVEINAMQKRVATDIMEEQQKYQVMEATLDNLINHVTQDITPEMKRPSNHLKFSYDYLDNKEARACFCFLAYEEIWLKDFFVDLQIIEDARNRVQIVVNTLKFCFMLSNGYAEETTKMHDLVQSMPSLIAYQGKNKLVVELLTKLRMLNIVGNLLFFDISMLAELKDLQILRVDGTRIKVIPRQIGELTNLRHMDASHYYNLCHIASDELFIQIYPKDMRNNHNLNEISTLSSLTWLELEVPNLDGIPKDVKFETLQKFEIMVGINHKATRSLVDFEITTPFGP